MRHQYESDHAHRCHVVLLDKYISKLTKDAKRKDLFYADLNLSNRRITLYLGLWPYQLFNTHCLDSQEEAKAQLEKDFTNHSLRAFGVTSFLKRMYLKNSYWNEAGTRSLEGLRQYKRTDMAQELQVCKVLAKKAHQNPGHWGQYNSHCLFLLYQWFRILVAVLSPIVFFSWLHQYQFKIRHLLLISAMWTSTTSLTSRPRFLCYYF